MDSEKNAVSVRSSLKVAYSILDENESRLKGFVEKIRASDKIIDAQGGIGGVLLQSVKSRFVIGKHKSEMQRSLDHALEELEKCSRLDPDAVLPTEDDEFSIAGLRALAYTQKGWIESLSGNSKKGISHFQAALEYAEAPLTYLLMGYAYEGKKEPGKALVTYEKCRSIDPEGEYGIDAAKEHARLKEKQIGNGWFVGSWKVALFLVGFTLLGIFTAFSDPNATGGAVIFAIITGIYFWRKWRVAPSKK